ncbi:MAG: hypothetical protein ABI072_05520 [Edaphobacter sp.]
MSSKHTNRTARRILKLASLGLAGLLAGLFAGCSSSPKAVSTTSSAYVTSTDQFESSNLPETLDSNSIPPLRHPPSARRLEAGSVHLSQVSAVNPGL